MHTDLPTEILYIFRASTFSSMALQLWYSLGNLDNVLPFKAVLYLFCPLHKLHLLRIMPDIILPSRLGLSCWSSCEWFSFVYSLYYASLGHSIYVSKPTQSLGFNIIYYEFHFFGFFIRAISNLYICIPTNCTQLIYFINNTLKHMYCLNL